VNGATWLPSLIVLGTGLVIGLLLAYRLRQASSTPSAVEAADLQLKIRDLEARREDLYRRLRGADEDHLSPAEIAALEETAARTLLELDQLSGQVPKRALQADHAPEAPPTPQVSSDAGRPARSPLVMGLAFGAGMVLIVALLVYWAIRDAQPKPQAGAPAPMAQGMEAPHEGQVQIPPELAQAIADLSARVTADPEDWPARKELALTQLAGAQFFEAFNQATQILQRFPEDPDGLFVHGVVRLTMGQTNQALDLMDRVLAQHPDHKQALLYRGLALYQMGNVEQAVDTWEMGLQMVGGRDPDFEELLAMARSGAAPAAPEMPPVSGSPAQGATVPSGTNPALQAPAADGFSLQIELAEGIAPAPEATLFIYLRTQDGGPPVAARRVVAPSFPAQITLTAADSMMGAELPDKGTAVVRLDSDGAASTTSEDDLYIEAPATKGQTVKLTLGG
jgi:cytochrome c-type biogenesis protein CcmH